MSTIDDIRGLDPVAYIRSIGVGDANQLLGRLRLHGWDDFWIVYRDRPEYEAGRAAWTNEMDGKGRWPRKAMVVKQKGPELGESIRDKIAKWDYEPEDSFGFCPGFSGGNIYFAWRKG